MFSCKKRSVNTALKCRLKCMMRIALETVSNVTNNQNGRAINERLNGIHMR